MDESNPVVIPRTLARKFRRQPRPKRQAGKSTLAKYLRQAMRPSGLGRAAAAGK